MNISPSFAGLACYVDEHIFIDQVDEVKRISSERYKRALPILLVTNDERFADQVRAAEPGYNILQTFQVTNLCTYSLNMSSSIDLPFYYSIHLDHIDNN